MRLPRLRLLFLVPLLALAAGCGAVNDLRDSRERPASLAPVVVETIPQRAYDTALTLAFDDGYQILYSDERDRLIELESYDRRVLRSDRVRRIDLFVRDESGETRIHTRVHSFTADDPGDIEVNDEDREAARELLSRLVARLEGRAAGNGR